MQSNSNSKSLKVSTNKRFKHDLSHQHLTTLDFFRLQPISLMECVAGDSININVRSLVEASPLATKVYGSCHLDLHAFFVPFRILWSEWNSYYYGDGGPYTPQLPYVPFGTSGFMNRVFGSEVTEGTESDLLTYKERRSIFGSLGYPVNFYNTSTNNTNLNMSALPARAYQQVWWDWFRDSSNIPEFSKDSYIDTTSGQISANSGWLMHFAPRYRTFRKDYITTILSPDQSAIDGSSADVTTQVGDKINENIQTYGLNLTSNGKLVYDYSTDPVLNNGYSVSQSIAVPILRGAIAMQRFLERLGITGSRPIERILSTFGIKPSPERLDMSEFIGSKTIPLNIDGLVNTGSSSKLDGDTLTNAFGDFNSSEIGTMTGRASAGGQTDTWSYNVTEHGYIMVIASIIPDYLNRNSVDRLFTRGLDPFGDGNVDFFQPDFDGSGYKPVLLKHIAWPTQQSTGNWVQGQQFKPNQVVGYQPYAEDYRIALDRISGDFNERGSSEYLSNMAFIRDLTDIAPQSVVAGLNLTTPTQDDKARFDNHFQVTNPQLDHFILNNYIKIDALRPISSSQMPTELSDMANKDLTEISKLGIRL